MIAVPAQVDVDVIVVIPFFLGLNVVLVRSPWLGLDCLFGLDGGGAVDDWWCGCGPGLDWFWLCVVFVAGKC